MLTWVKGPQMVGWTLVHSYAGLFVLGMLATILLHAWLVAYLVVWVYRRLTKKAYLPLRAWTQFVLLGCTAILFYIPYEAWQFVTLEVAGPGWDIGRQLTTAVAENHGYLVRAFIRSGIPVDTPDWNNRTAADEACLVGNVELAHYLISHKAQLDRAPDCRKIPEFAAEMKPLTPEVEEHSGRPRMPTTTIEVTAPDPRGDYNRFKAKP